MSAYLAQDGFSMTLSAGRLSLRRVRFPEAMRRAPSALVPTGSWAARPTPEQAPPTWWRRVRDVAGRRWLVSHLRRLAEGQDHGIDQLPEAHGLASTDVKHSLHVRRQPSVSVRRPSTRAASFSLAHRPLDRLSSTRTQAPRASNTSTVCEPMMPAPPVMTRVNFESGTQPIRG
jgi:hypothetical protein